MDLNNLQPGESVVYWTGTCIAKTCDESRYTAWEMYMRDEADLTQRKIKVAVPAKDGTDWYHDEFQYIITRRKALPNPTTVFERREHYKFKDKC